MFFENITQLNEIAKKTSCSIFVINPTTKLDLRHALYLTPDAEKKSSIITVDQIRDFIGLTNNREVEDNFFVITPADAMNEAAQNAFLKTFEEPRTYCHFVLLTQDPSLLLPTILSRAQIYIYKTLNCLNQPPTTSAKIVDYAKQLIAAQPKDLSELASALTKTKVAPREQALEVTATAIELLYKSYFKTKNIKFLTKIQNFINLHEHLSQNCHIKLHIVADLC